ncbi:MAG: hypothetical protein H0U70_08845 [Tatlockia sp.]|nr:hypothetical protein [Tatlockia sp.]
MRFLNKLLSFLFINSKINSLLEHHELYMIAESKTAKIIYKKLIRQYLGLGFPLSFLPGTEAYAARINLLSVIARLEEYRQNSTLDNIYIHLFKRTLASIKYSLDRERFQGDKVWGANRLNPFFYLTQMGVIFVGLLARINFKLPPQLEFLGDYIVLLDHLLIPLYIITFVMLVLVMCVHFTLYFATEILLNSLNSLIMEPFIFAYEVLKQFFEKEQFTQIPSIEYSELDPLRKTIDMNGEVIETDKQARLEIPKCYPTTEKTLIEGSKELINSFKFHQNTLFFKAYKNTGFFQQDKEIIQDSHAQLKAMQAFYWFALQLFPIELSEIIFDCCVKTPTLGLLSPRLRNLTHKTAEEELNYSNYAII